MTIAILGPETDRQVRRVTAELDDRGAETVVWNPEQWPGSTPLSFGVGSDMQITMNGDPVDREELSAVYHRRIGMDPRDAAFQEQLETRPYSLMNQIREYRGLLVSGPR